MGECFLPLARDLGYRASFFNLVFVTNKVTVILIFLSDFDNKRWVDICSFGDGKSNILAYLRSNCEVNNVH